jgi:hypothetical protein
MSWGPRVLVQCMAVTGRFCNHHICKKRAGSDRFQVVDTYRMEQTRCSVHTSGRPVQHKTPQSEALFYIIFCTRITALHSFFNVSHTYMQTLPKAKFGDQGGHNILFILLSTTTTTTTTTKRYVNRARTFRNSYCLSGVQKTM